MKKAIFLDRDGVINHDPGDYTRKLDEFTLLDGLMPALEKFNDEGYEIIVITNQGGIAKGEYSLEDFYEIDEFMHRSFKENGIHVLKTYFCPHHEIKTRCVCRKPGSAMIEKALAVHQIDASASVMIGDKVRDIEAAEKAGVRGILVDVNADLRSINIH